MGFKHPHRHSECYRQPHCDCLVVDEANQPGKRREQKQQLDECQSEERGCNPMLEICGIIVRRYPSKGWIKKEVETNRGEHSRQRCRSDYCRLDFQREYRTARVLLVPRKDECPENESAEKRRRLDIPNRERTFLPKPHPRQREK